MNTEPSSASKLPAGKPDASARAALTDGAKSVPPIPVAHLRLVDPQRVDLFEQLREQAALEEARQATFGVSLIGAAVLALGIGATLFL